MHLPDGFLSPAIWIPAAAASALTVTFAWRRATHGFNSASSAVTASHGFNSASSAVTASLAAFVFAAQSLQFPIPGGAAGHLLGGSLITILAGAPRAIIALSAVFTIQAFFFRDGGATALGANILNGAIIPIGVTAAFSYLFRNVTLRKRAAVAGIASFLGILCGAIACAVEVGASGTAPFLTFFGALLGAHVWIAAGEGFITSQLVLLLYPKVSEWMQNDPGAAQPRLITNNRSTRPLWICIFVVAAVAVAAEFLASRAPDGLEAAAMRAGLIHHNTETGASAPSWAAAFLSMFGAGAAALAVILIISFARARKRSV
ncbi:MAG: energy-coupling factor ABC transporter permease [Planctomycetota bacterium]